MNGENSPFRKKYEKYNKERRERKKETGGGIFMKIFLWDFFSETLTMRIHISCKKKKDEANLSSIGQRYLIKSN